MEWIKVSNRLPEFGDLVLTSHNGRVPAIYIAAWEEYRGEKYWVNDEGLQITNVTHWQPLPKPPKE